MVALILDDRPLMHQLQSTTVAPERLAHYEEHHRQLMLLCALGAALDKGRKKMALDLESQFRLGEITRGYRDLIEWCFCRLQLELHPRSSKVGRRKQQLTERLGYTYLQEG